MQEIDELLKAITALEAQRQSLGDKIVDAALAPLQEKLVILGQAEPASQQRRLVSVLFLDIVNSTILSQGLEPEEVQEVIGGSLKRLSLPIEAHGGVVTQFMGDGFVAVFGLTRIHENDARQAVRAGLAILTEAQACADTLENRYKLSGFTVRMGINTGRVVIGRFARAESPVMGLTVSLAARIEQSSQPGTLYISQFTRQHVRGAFELKTLAPIEAKGFVQSVEVYQVLSALPRTFRTFTRGVEDIKTSLVGRRDELQQMKTSMWNAIRQRETCLVTVVGEAGVGKSRLLYEFDRWVAKLPSRVIAFKVRSSPQMMTLPFGMLRDMLCYRLGVLITDQVEYSRQRLVKGMSGYLGDEGEMKAHFIGSLLGFDFSGSPYLQGVEGDPRQLSDRAQLYLLQYFAAVANQMPAIIMLDDLHWADTPSVSFIARLVRECPKLPLLVICLARPVLAERFPDWGEQDSFGDLDLSRSFPLRNSLQLVLGPLSRQDSLELLEEILRNVEALPKNLRDHILDRADGNPFYIEEYIQALVDAKAICRGRAGGQWRLDTEQLSSLVLPSTLTALLEARLDSLSIDQRALLQQASVIGRVFWSSALEAIRGEKPINDSDLGLLSRRGFIYLQESSTFAGIREYCFHHALLRDVAYQVLVKSDRQAYHGQVAAWLIGATQESGRTDEFAPVIAEHYELAVDQAHAVDWYVRSGTRARNQGAPAQARSFFDHAMSLLPPDTGQPFTESQKRRRWDVLAGRDEVLGILGDTQARLADDQALVALAETLGDDSLVAEAYYRRGYYLGVCAQYAQELEAYQAGLAAARRINDRSHEALILGVMVICELRLGHIEAAEQAASSALVSAEQLGDDQILARNLSNSSAFYTETGDMGRAAQLLQRQLEISRRIANIDGEVIGLNGLGYSYILLGIPKDAIPLLQRCVQLAETIGHRNFGAYGCLNLALAYLRSGDSPSALARLAECQPDLLAMKDKFGYAVSQTYTALAMEQAGQVGEALHSFENAAATLREIGTLGNAQDADAGSARCLLSLKNLPAARQYAGMLWDYLQQQSGTGMELPVLGYETCADVFLESGEPALARLVVEQAKNELMKRAERISLPEWRQSFLERVPEHRRILARSQNKTMMSED